MYTEKQKKAIAELKKKYSVKNVKFFRGMEGTGFNLSLYENGKKICDVDDAAYGGDYDFSNSDVEMRIDRELKEKVGEFDYGNTKLVYDAEMMVDELVTEFEINKTYKKACKTKTLILIKDGREDKLYSADIPYSNELAKKIRVRYGKDLLEIINERFL